MDNDALLFPSQTGDGVKYLWIKERLHNLHRNTETDVLNVEMVQKKNDNENRRENIILEAEVPNERLHILNTFFIINTF